MSTVIAVLVLVIIIGAVAYLVRARKKGHKCIGCPAGGSCAVKNLKHLEHSQHECGCHSEK